MGEKGIVGGYGEKFGRSGAKAEKGGIRWGSSGRGGQNRERVV
jgi:hypothetical protein